MSSRSWFGFASKVADEGKASQQASPNLSGSSLPSESEIEESSPSGSQEDRALRLIGQLTIKSEQGKLRWTTGFEDGQFVTSLPNGGLAFVIQVKEGVRSFTVLDESQEMILNEAVQGRYTAGVVGSTPGSPTLQTFDANGLLRFTYIGEQRDVLFEAIGSLQELARAQALRVNDKLTKAERLLAAI